MSLETYASFSLVPLQCLCKATVKVFFSSSKQRVIAACSKRFGQSISTEMGTIRDCHIAGYNKSNNEIILFGFASGNDVKSGRNFNNIQNLFGAGSFENLLLSFINFI